MQLNAYLRSKKITSARFAEQLGGVTVRSVRNWRYRERTPSAAMIVKISDATDGIVTVIDWVKQ